MVAEGKGSGARHGRRVKIERKAKKQQMIEVKQAEHRVPTIFADQAQNNVIASLKNCL